MQDLKPLFPYHGGKWRLAPKIVPLLPPHIVYTEPFCGCAAVYWKKGRPTHEMTNYREALNDRNGDLATVYSVVKDPTKMQAVMTRLAGVPYSRGVYETDRHYQEGDDDVSRTYRFLLRTCMAFSSVTGSRLSGWGYGANGPQLPLEWSRYKTRVQGLIDKYAARIDATFLDSKDAIPFMEAWDQVGTCHYVDPPYVDTSQHGYDGYTVDNYRRLLEFLGDAKGSVVLSGYPNEYVSTSWPYVDFAHSTSAAPGTMRTGTTERIERLWILDRSGDITPEIWKRIKTAYAGWRSLPGVNEQATLFA